jgi:hypothetical protein
VDIVPFTPSFLSNLRFNRDLDQRLSKFKSIILWMFLSTGPGESKRPSSHQWQNGANKMKLNKKLSFQKETILTLSESQVAEINGAMRDTPSSLITASFEWCTSRNGCGTLNTCKSVDGITTIPC